jgi:thiosulfate/3-mercaptopyruvate sulfurtransferase
MRISPIIEVEELINIYKNPNVLIFDVRNGINAKTNYAKKHLEGAIFINLNTQLADIKDDFANGGRHPLPQLSHFSKTLTDVGIRANAFKNLKL